MLPPRLGFVGIFAYFSGLTSLTLMAVGALVSNSISVMSTS
jgi:hypothetical protein